MAGIRAWQRQFDAMAFPAFAGVGLGDTGTYRSPDGVETSITYLYDEEQMIDAGSPESGVAAFVRSRQIGIMAATVTVEANGLVIGDDGRTWRLTKWTGERDDSMQWWACAPVRGDGA